jgi:serine protease Do
MIRFIAFAFVLFSQPLLAAAPSGLPDFTQLMREEGPAVVNVIVKSEARAQAGAGASLPPGVPDDFSDFFRRFMPQQPPGGGVRQGMGSGFIVSADGYVLTNAHVVADADEVTVRLADAKREFKAKVVGSDERTDVALLKIDATGLPTVRLGSSSNLQPGQWVAAIGSPFGFANTITAGIISATGRSLPSESYVPFIQTDVAVNPGNSGGPLINTAGEVIGINSMIYSGTGGYMGVSFAIPIELALDVSKQLRATGKVTRGRIGVGIQPVTKELAQAFGLKEPRGALISSVEPESPAARAGLKPGDIVLSYAGKPVEEVSDLPRRVASTKPGDEAQMEILRDGKRQSVSVTVGEFPAASKTAKAGGSEDASLGITVSELAPQERKDLGVDYGLVVQSVQKPGSPLRQGDVILGVNRQSFSSLQEFRQLVAEHKGGTAALRVRRGDASVFVPVPVG